MNQIVEIAKLPMHEWKPKVAEYQAMVEKSGNPLGDLVITVNWPEVIKSQSNLRSAIAALVSERFRLARNAWPKSLQILVKEKYLANVPTDPINGASMRFHATADGVVIYSIGENGIDEHGNMGRHGFKGRSDDRGFRLWDERFRGQPSIAPVAQPRIKE